MKEFVLVRRMVKELAEACLRNELVCIRRSRRNEPLLELAGALGAGGLLGALYFARR